MCHYAYSSREYDILKSRRKAWICRTKRSKYNGCFVHCMKPCSWFQIYSDTWHIQKYRCVHVKSPNHSLLRVVKIFPHEIEFSVLNRAAVKKALQSIQHCKHVTSRLLETKILLLHKDLNQICLINNWEQFSRLSPFEKMGIPSLNSVIHHCK